MKHRSEIGEDEKMRRREFQIMVCYVSLFMAGFLFIVFLLFIGCSNFLVRVNNYLRSDPYVLHHHPYFSTGDARNDYMYSPFQFADGRVLNPIWTSIATPTWPFFGIGEVGEVSLDTEFLSSVAINRLCKNTQT